MKSSVKVHQRLVIILNYDNLDKKIQACYGKHLAAFSKDIINDDSNKVKHEISITFFSLIIYHLKLKLKLKLKQKNFI